MSDANGRESVSSVREPFATLRDSDANAQGIWLSASEAAKTLGVGVRTVQKRAAKGDFASRFEEGRRLFVCLEGRERDANQVVKDANFREQDANAVREAPPMPDALLEQLRSENTFLRSELTAQREAHTDEIARRDNAENEYRRLLLTDRQEIARLRDQIAIAAAPADVQEVATGTPGGIAVKQEPQGDRAQNGADDPPRRWWQRQRRP